MPDSLDALQTTRSEVLQQFLTLGDLRPGSITVGPRRRCGKPTCHCAQPDDPGHDPQLRLTRKVDATTVTESFPNPAALRKAQLEVAEFRRFEDLSRQLVTVNERICALRPADQESSGWTEQEKKTLLQSIRRLRAKSTP